MRKLLILRPEPGATATAQLAKAIGIDPFVCPLFDFEALPWTAPDPAGFDAMLLTSANALRFGAAGLAALTDLPSFAVGEVTASAAREAGFRVEQVGTAGVGQLLAAVPPGTRLLHLCGENFAGTAANLSITHLPVYRAAEIADATLPDLAGVVVAVHSPRAGKRLAELASDRATTAVAAISEVAAGACGDGWQRVAWVDQPTDPALLALAARLCQSPD